MLRTRALADAGLAALMSSVGAFVAGAFVADASSHDDMDAGRRAGDPGVRRRPHRPLWLSSRIAQFHDTLTPSNVPPDPVSSPLRLLPDAQASPTAATLQSPAVVSSSGGSNIEFIEVTGDPLLLFTAEPDLAIQSLEQRVRHRDTPHPSETAEAVVRQKPLAPRSSSSERWRAALSERWRAALAPLANIRLTNPLANLRRINVALGVTAILMAGVGAFSLVERGQPAVKMSMSTPPVAGADIELPGPQQVASEARAEDAPARGAAAARGAAPARVAVPLRVAPPAHVAAPSPVAAPPTATRKATRPPGTPPPARRPGRNATTLNALAASAARREPRPEDAVAATPAKLANPVEAPSEAARAPVRPSSSAMTTSRTEAAASPSREIFGPSDLEVAPPTAVQPSLLATLSPTSPNVRLDALTIAVVIGANGAVESVKAVNPPQTMSEAVLVTAALSGVKSWRFHPATKNGIPVRYREVVPLGRLTQTTQ